MKVGAIILNYKRDDTVQAVVDSVVHQTRKLDAIYVWNNNPEITTNFSGVININSQENVLCIVRHAFALAKTDIDYWAFIDDDTKIKPDSIKDLLAYSQKYPNSIIGYYGRNIIPQHYYSLAQTNFFRGQEIEVDIILGIVHFCHRNKLLNSFLLKKALPNLSMTEDDILLSLANKYLDGGKNYVIPYSNNGGPISLPSKHKGLSVHPQHILRRRDAVKTILDWKGISVV